MNARPGVKGFVRVPVAERFWTRVEKHDDDCPCCDGCWFWTGAKRGRGYGDFYMDGHHRAAHQVAWELHHGVPFPEGKDGCHTCDRTSCVRPDHIWPGTQSENTLDASAKGRMRSFHGTKTHCKHGHPLSGENLMLLPSGYRRCRTCDRATHRRSWRRAALAALQETPPLAGRNPMGGNSQAWNRNPGRALQETRPTGTENERPGDSVNTPPSVPFRGEPTAP